MYCAFFVKKRNERNEMNGSWTAANWDLSFLLRWIISNYLYFLQLIPINIIFWFSCIRWSVPVSSVVPVKLLSNPLITCKHDASTKTVMFLCFLSFFCEQISHFPRVADKDRLKTPPSSQQLRYNHLKFLLCFFSLHKIWCSYTDTKLKCPLSNYNQL